jgi:hypothetical protein
MIHLAQYLVHNQSERYIRVGITGNAKHSIPLTLYTDASHKKFSKKRSIGGAIMTLGYGPIWHRSKIIKVPCDSTTESELLQLQETAKHVLWAKRLLTSMGLNVNTKIFEDNTATISLIESRGQSHAIKLNM